MSVIRPYHLTVRQFADGGYSEGARYRYILHGAYGARPSNYIRAFMLLQKDLLELFNYIEPGDRNLQTYSMRIQELLIRTCIEIEANFKAILAANKYESKSPANLSIKDYFLIDKTHFLSQYDAKLPYWTGNLMHASREPFKDWVNPPSAQAPWKLAWYAAYNSTKHDRANALESATFEHLIDAFSALIILLSAQYMFEDFSPAANLLETDSGWNDGYDPAIGDYYRIHFPTRTPITERYDFDWAVLGSTPEPFDRYDYDALKSSLGL